MVGGLGTIWPSKPAHPQLFKILKKKQGPCMVKIDSEGRKVDREEEEEEPLPPQSVPGLLIGEIRVYVGVSEEATFT